MFLFSSISYEAKFVYLNCNSNFEKKTSVNMYRRPKNNYLIWKVNNFSNFCRKITKQVSFERGEIIFLSHAYKSTQRLLHRLQCIFELETWIGWSHVAEDLHRSMPGISGSVALLLQYRQVELDELLASCSPTEKNYNDLGQENVGVTWSQTCLKTTYPGTSSPANRLPILKC